MNVYRRLTGRCICLAAAVVLASATGAGAEATSQPALEPVKAPATGLIAEGIPSNVGAVTGNDVYVRSGFHQNYYAVTKLNKGDQVTVLGEEYGWLKIAPPPGTYSLVEKALIDKDNDQAGTANGDATVYAGSNLNDRRYAKQVRLSKGAKVQLIGETSDGGYYKIQPPAGAVLWIKADFVDRSGKSESRIEPVKVGELASTETAATTRPSAEAMGPEKPKTMAAKELAQTANETQLDIKAIEALIAAESTKPVTLRKFDPIIAKLRPLADQSEDRVAKHYATVRIKQLQEEIQIAKALADIQASKEKAIADADRIAAERAKIKVEEAAPMDDIAVRGEIRASKIYDGTGGKPLRWRIVSRDDRTIAFVEVPQGSPIDPVQYYGQYVGVRASERRLMQDVSPPLPIYTVKEILVQDPAAVRAAEMAGGNPPVVPAPSSQPSMLVGSSSQGASDAAQGPEATPVPPAK